jgi:hypothetical protein
MKRQFLALLAAVLLVVGYQKASAQSVYYIDSQGKAIRDADNELDNIKGTPFMYEQWVFGTFVNAEGTLFKNIKLKYNVYNDQLIFAGSKGEMMAFDKPVKQFTLNETLFANGFPAIDAFGSDTYYQVLGEGSTKLLKHYSKHVEKNSTYGSAMASMRFADNEAWYLFKDGKISALKLDKKNVLAALNDKSTQVNNYLSNHKVNFKNDMELSNLLAYYNSL